MPRRLARASINCRIMRGWGGLRRRGGELARSHREEVHRRFESFGCKLQIGRNLRLAVLKRSNAIRDNSKAIFAIVAKAGTFGRRHLINRYIVAFIREGIVKLHLKRRIALDEKS